MCCCYASISRYDNKSGIEFVLWIDSYESWDIFPYVFSMILDKLIFIGIFQLLIVFWMQIREYLSSSFHSLFDGKCYIASFKDGNSI